MPRTLNTVFPDRASIYNTIGQANPGDTVVVGNQNNVSSIVWDTALLVNQNIILQFPGNSLAIQGGTPSGPQLGAMLVWTVQDGITARLTGMRFWQTIDQGGNGKGALQLAGYSSLANGGGMRIDNCYFNSDPNARITQDGVTVLNSNIVTSATMNFTTADVGMNIGATALPAGTTVVAVNSATSVTVSANATASTTTARLTIGAWVGSGEYVFSTSGFIDGVMDHCTVDYPVGSGASEIFDCSHNGDPNDPQTPQKFRGELSWSMPYVHGGNPATNSRAFFFEDNKIHYKGIWFDSIKGGGRYVVRYNTIWGAVGGHGTDTGANLGVRAKEVYNNVFLVPDGYSISSQAMTCRGGSFVACNNYITNYVKPFGLLLYRMAGTSTCVGPADGTTPLDNNHNNQNGPLIVNGVTFTPVRTPSDVRIGSVYAQGTNAVQGTGQNIRVYNLPTAGTNLAGSVANQWVGFVLRNQTQSPNPPDGNGGNSTSNNYGQIISSTADTGTGQIQVTIGQPVGTPPAFASTDTWELRYVDEYFAQPGAGQLQQTVLGGTTPYRLNNGPNWQELDSNYVPITGTNPRWLGQEHVGLWQQNNYTRANSTGTYVPSSGFGATALVNAVTPGSVNDNAIPSTGYLNPSNPQRAGADTDFPGYHEIIPSIPDPSVGFTYPHPLISGANFWNVSATESLGTSESASANAYSGITAADVLLMETGDMLLTEDGQSIEVEPVMLHCTAAESLGTSEGVTGTGLAGAAMLLIETGDLLLTEDGLSLQIEPVTYSVTANDSLTTSDVTASTKQFGRTATESLSVAMSSVPSFIYVRTASDAPHIAQTISRRLNYVKTVAESLATAELVIGSKGNVLTRTVAESVSTNEALTNPLLASRAAAEATAIAESLTRKLVLVRAVADSLATQDQGLISGVEFVFIAGWIAGSKLSVIVTT